MTISAESEILPEPVLVLVGPTAIGKTRLSFEMARRFNCEIVSVDSMQIYRYMDIGTAKPSSSEQKEIRHHLVDIVDPDCQYDAARFVSDALTAMQSIAAAGRIPLLTGGTGLYLKALTTGFFHAGNAEDQATVRNDLYARLEEQGREVLFKELEKVDPATAARIHPNDTQRLIRALEIHQLTGKPWSLLIQQQESPTRRFGEMRQICLTCERDLLYERIERRTKQMLEQGLVAEVEKLRDMGYGPLLQSMQAIGYRHVNNLIDGKWDRSETVRLLIRDTRRYAKRQMTWFSRTSSLVWYDRESTDAIMRDTEQWLNNQTKSSPS